MGPDFAAALRRPASGPQAGSRLRAAVVGAGQIAQQHLACLSRLPGVQIVAVCDLSAALAECACEKYRAQAWFTDHARMLDTARPDVVHIATPPASHFAIARDALESGAHVFLEKPATTSMEELLALLSLADAKDRMLVENYNYLWNEPVLRLRERVAEGRLGRIQHVDVMLCLDVLGKDSPFMDANVPHPVHRLRGGIIGDFLPHLASLAYGFCGPLVRGHALWDESDTGLGRAPTEFRGLLRGLRASATLAFSARAQPDSFRLSVYGSRARASAELFEHRLTLASLRELPRPLIPFANSLDEARVTGRSAFGLLWRKLSGGPGAYDGLWRLIGHFYEAGAAARPWPLSTRDVHEVNRIVQAMLPGAQAP